MKQMKLMIVIVLLMALALCSCATTGIPTANQASPVYANDKDRTEMLGHLQKLEDPDKTVRSKAMMELLKFGPDLEKILPELIEISKTSDGKNNSDVVASFCLDFIGEKADEALIVALRDSLDRTERTNLVRMLCLGLDRPIPSLLRYLKTANDPEFSKDLLVALVGCGYGRKATVCMSWIGRQPGDYEKSAMILNAIKQIQARPNPPDKYPK